MDTYVALNDLWVRALLLASLLNIPLDDQIIWNSDLLEQIHRAPPATSQRAHDKTSRHPSDFLLALLQRSLDVVDEQPFIRIRLHARESLRGFLQLMTPSLDSQRSARESSMEAKRRDSPSHLVRQELKIQQRAPSARKPRQHVLPSTLAFIAMRKLDVSVFQRERLFWQFLETDDQVVCGRGRPAAFRDEGCAYLAELFVVEDSEGGTLDVDWVAGFEE